MSGKKILFSASDPSHGTELWVTDGTSAGTYVLYDINPGATNSYPTDITPLGDGTAVFEADDGTQGAELWVTDGTTVGTSLVEDIYPGLIGSDPRYITAAGVNKAVFSAHEGTDGTELWVTNGTASGTYLLKDINPGSAGSYPTEITPIGNGEVLFSANDAAHGTQLWVTDGTAGGTSMVTDINAGAGGPSPADITSLGNGKALFSATDGIHGYELWITDGTSDGTSLVLDIDAGPVSSYPTDITEIGPGEALFQANDGANGAELWVTNGTAAGTSMLKDVNTGPGSAYPHDITALGNGKALFAADDGIDGTELWVTDGTSTGTSLVKDINPGSAGSNPSGITSLGDGRALFSANDGTNGTELWVTDGTANGTYLVTDIDPGSGGSYPGDITAIGNGEALFSATDGTNGYALWESDGTPDGTFLVRSAGALPAASNPSDLTVLVACFLAGTRIQTPDGDCPVENLRVGDQVVTHFGGQKRVRWIGYRHIDLTRCPDPCRVTPVRIGAGAFGGGLPRRDLLVSPDHALFVGGKLVPALLLLNEASIVTDTSLRRLTYYHVELDRHDILFAEGLPAESYLDTGNRNSFENAGALVALRPEFSLGQRDREARSCAPFTTHPATVEPIWRRLALMAETIGRRLPERHWTDEPDLHLQCEDLTWNPAVVDGGRYCFVVPALSRRLRLVSRAARPRDARPWIEDGRCLGVMIRRMTWRQGHESCAIAMDDPRLAEGWWGVEWQAGEPCRWTSGDAVLPLLPVGTAGILTVEVSCSLLYSANLTTDGSPDVGPTISLASA